MNNKIFLSKCAKKLAKKSITGEDVFNLMYPGCSLVSPSIAIKKFEDCGLNPWFFKEYFHKCSYAKSKEEQEDLDEQLEYDLTKTSKWIAKNKKEA